MSVNSFFYVFFFSFFGLLIFLKPFLLRLLIERRLILKLYSFFDRGEAKSPILLMTRKEKEETQKEKKEKKKKQKTTKKEKRAIDKKTN